MALHRLSLQELIAHEEQEEQEEQGAPEQPAARPPLRFPGAHLRATTSATSATTAPQPKALTIPFCPGVATSDLKQIAQAFRAFSLRDEPLYFDVETTGLDPHTNRLVMVQLRQKSSKTDLIIDWRAFSSDTSGSAGARDAAPEWVRTRLNELFATHRVVGHNIKFDLQFMLAVGVQVPNVFDTMIAEQLLVGQGYGSGEGFRLADVVAKRLGVALSKTERTWFYEPAPLDERPEEWVAPFPAEEVEYAAKDVDVLVPLHEVQRALLEQEGLLAIAKIEMRALPAFAAMEYRGIRVNTEGWRAFIAEKAVEAKQLEAEVMGTFAPPILAARIARYDAALEQWKQAREALKQYETDLRAAYAEKVPDSVGIAWGEYKKDGVAKFRESHPVPAKPKLDTTLPNIGSTHQLIDALEGLGIPVPLKPDPKTGAPKKTTDSENLEALAPNYPALKTIVAFRKASKFVDAFGEKLLAFARAETVNGETIHVIHPDYRQIGADTGRTSCTKPNWQQVPSKGDGKRLRACVIARPGHLFAVADLSNFELRALADLSGDQKMLDLFASGEDLHSMTAKLMFHLPMDWTKEQCDGTEWRGGLSYRKAAKIVNYLIPYGGSAFAIAQQNGIPRAEADELLANWQAMFAGAHRFLVQAADDVHDTLCSRTKAGRLRRFTDPGKKPPRRSKPYIPHDRAPEGYELAESGQVWLEPWEQYKLRLNPWKKAWSSIERQARNNPMQGMNADVIKLAMAMFQERCPPHMGWIVASVHDELVVEGPTRYIYHAAEYLADAMEEAPRTYLQDVAIPRPRPTISDKWEHD